MMVALLVFMYTLLEEAPMPSSKTCIELAVVS